jgi:hypothetical protein
MVYGANHRAGQRLGEIPAAMSSQKCCVFYLLTNSDVGLTGCDMTV